MLLRLLWLLVFSLVFEDNSVFLMSLVFSHVFELFAFFAEIRVSPSFLVTTMGSDAPNTTGSQRSLVHMLG